MDLTAPNHTKLSLTVNGQAMELDGPALVSDLVEKMGLKNMPCAVELNRRVIPRRMHDEAPLAQGDHVEIVTLVGGG